MRRVVLVDPASVLPTRRQALVRAGVPADRTPSGRTIELLEKAISHFLLEADPIGVLEELSHEELLAIHHDGTPARGTSVLDVVTPRASRLALFAATVGESICERIRALFAGGNAPLGLFLDALASEAATALAGQVGKALVEERPDPRLAVLAYSPGYCGWPVTGQRALFARLDPGEIGISLGESSLMSPVKSVSGVLVAAPASAHRFRPAFEFCDACTDRTCLERMAALRSPSGPAVLKERAPWTS